MFVDKPEQAPWLTEFEKRLVVADLEADQHKSGPRTHGFGKALKTPRLWLLTLIYFCITSCVVTIGFFVPSIIPALGVTSKIMIGLLSAIPSIGSLITMILLSRHSDRTMERRYHVALPCLVGAAGLVGIGLFANSPLLAFLALVLAVAAPQSAVTVFWAIPASILGGSAAAGGIALINSIGNLSGWAGPSVVGGLADITGKVSTGLYLVAGLEVLATVLVLRFIPRRSVIASVDGAPLGDTADMRGESVQSEKVT